MQPGEALGVAAQVAVTLAGFAGIVAKPLRGKAPNLLPAVLPRPQPLRVAMRAGSMTLQAGKHQVPRKHQVQTLTSKAEARGASRE